MQANRRTFIASQVEEATRDATALGNPAILFLFVVLVSRELWIGVLIGLAAVEIAGRLVKLVVFTPRPRATGYASLWEKSDAGSFPSIHAARSAFVCSVLWSTADEHLARIMFVAIPVAVGLSRVRLHTHRWGEVAAGWGLGLLAAFLWWGVQ